MTHQKQRSLGQWVLLLSGIALATPALGQSASAIKPGNCAIWAEEGAKVVAADPRFTHGQRTQAATALNKFAAAQQAIANQQMPEVYQQAKAFGWDKATVDSKMAAAELALRKGFVTSTMSPDKLYMDHVLKLYECAQRATSESELGEAPTVMRQVFNDLAVVAKQP